MAGRYSPTPNRWKRVRWSNGVVDAAPTWQALLDLVRATQMRTWTEEEFRLVLAKRAVRWSGYELDIYASPRQLFHQMEEARLVTILHPDESEKEV